ncbi:AsmA family protein [Pseudosulfitobacter koreensis]|uniref:AsmA family protein n=1 Tax=Pseudosulfitobacter koreensis TaxID=2968472 RepID=A0ABT1Z2T1_9RHOB|nr:AsmA family protein [Pseudosulfitobacter koreense]MCR8827447.1 AsmA family protein [Pseudosulfitobacter koreense]
MKWIARLIGLVVVVVLVIGVSLFFLPADRIARIAADQLRVATGRDVTISGDVSLSIWPVLGASVGSIEIGNATWSEQGPMLTAQNAAIGVDAAALLSGEIRITNIAATSPTIRLEQRQDGRASWQFTDASGAATIETQVTPNEAPRPFSIQRMNITDATLIYDAEGADLVRYEGVDLALDWPERLGTADIRATLRPAGTAVNVNATIGSFAGFLGGQVQPITATLSAGGGSASIDGRAGTAGEVAGKLTLDLPDTGAFLQALGAGGVDLPQGLGRSIDLTSDITLTKDRRLSMRDLVAELGGNRLTGAADIALNGTPTVNAQLNAGALDLTGVTGTGDASPAGAAASGTTTAGWPKETIDASGLAAFNGQIALTATSVDLGTFQLGATRALLTNDNSRAVFDLREVDAYEGKITGQFVMNNRNGLSVGGKLFATSIAMQPLLTDALGLTRLTGDGNAELNFLSSGNSVDAIMNALSGSGAIAIGKGTIQGIDLDRLMRSGATGSGTTVFDSLGATFDMTAGNLRNDDLLLSLASYRARGQGRVGLGQQDIDYTFTPIALNANEGNGIAIPVRITGPWSDLRIIPDIEAAIDLNLGEKKEELKDAADARLKAAVEEKLGVTAQQGQSLEDAAKDKAKEKLAKELMKIFD